MKPKHRFPAAVLAVLVFAAAAYAGDNISNSSWESIAPRAAFDSTGNLYVVWAEFYGDNRGDLFFSKYTLSTESWSAPFNVSNSGRVFSDTIEVGGLAVDDANLVWVVWTESSAVRLRTLSGTQWTAPVTVGGGLALQGAKVAAIGQGECHVVWWGNNGVVQARSRINQKWESSRVISASGRRSKFSDIAVGSNWVMATWVEKTGDDYQAGYVHRLRTSGATWSSPRLVYRQSISQQHAVVEFLNGTQPHIVMTPLIEPARYVAHAAWTGQGFASPQRISAEGMLHYPSLATGGGRMIAAWQVGAFGNGRAIYFNEYTGGSWQGETAIPGSGGGTYCDVAVHSEGALAFVWDSNGEIFALLTTNGEEPTPNVDPVAQFSFTPATGSAPLTVSFDAGASYDTDGTIARYDWSFGDGQSAAGKVVSHTFAVPGTYTNTLTVTDNLGATGTRSKPLTAINKAPVPAFTVSSPSMIVPTKVDFDAGASVDPDGTIVQYDWVFGDGPTAQGPTFSRLFTLPGTFSLTLTVTDNFGKKASLAKTLTLVALQAPLNIRYESFTDESLFQSRIVTDVRWDPNPANEAIAAIVKYRVYRTAAGSGAPYQLAVETDGATFFWRDVDVETAGQYVYTVTSLDAAGHESLMPLLPAAEPGSRSRRSSSAGAPPVIRR